MANNAARIAEIKDLLALGVTSTSADGNHTSFDLDALRRELRQLEAEDDTSQTKRPVAASVYLGGF